MSKKLDTETRLQCAHAAFPVLLKLKEDCLTMRYGEFAKVIGLIDDDTDGGHWQPWHRSQVTDILNIVAAVEKQAGEHGRLEYERLTNGHGKPGDGVYKYSHIKRT